MASAQLNRLLHCCSCGGELTVNSHSLPCLHTLCQTCMKDETLTEEDDSNSRKCPKCGEVFNGEEELNLLPFLSTYIKCQSKEVGCHFCCKEDILSVAKKWCFQCEQFFCNICNRIHKQMGKNHICKDLDGISHSEWKKFVMSEKCILHGKERSFYCEGCKECFCDTCYSECHSSSGCASVRMLSVREEVARRKTEECPIVEKQVKEFARIVSKSNEKLKRCQDEMNDDYDKKLYQIWSRFDEKVEIARLEAIDLSADVDRNKSEEERETTNWLHENDTILQQIEIWLLNWQYLANEAEKKVDILGGLNLLKSQIRCWEKKIIRKKKEKKIEFSSVFSNLLLETIDSPFSFSSSIKKLEKQEEWNLLPGSKPRRIESIHVVEEDGHVFLCDFNNRSLIELSEFGECVNEFSLLDERSRNPNFFPRGICSISPDILVVCGCGGVLRGGQWVEGGGGKVFFIKRIKIPPFLKIETIIETKDDFISLCKKNDLIFICDINFEISCFTKKGEKIKTFKINGFSGSPGSIWFHRIRVDPCSGNLWGLRYDFSEIVSFNSEGEKLSSMKKEKDFGDFYLNKLGHFIFSTPEEIFSFFPEKKPLFKFDKKSENFPDIFVSENKMFACVRNEGITVIKIFKIFY